MYYRKIRDALLIFIFFKWFTLLHYRYHNWGAPCWSEVSDSRIKTEFSRALYRQIHAVTCGICCLPQIDLEMSLRVIFLKVSSRFLPFFCATVISEQDQGKRPGKGCGPISSCVWGAASSPASQSLASPASVFHLQHFLCVALLFGWI